MFLLLAAIAVATLSYALTRGMMRRSGEDQGAWLRREFQLTDAQSAAIDRMRAEYEPVCADHCRLIREARGLQVP